MSCFRIKISVRHGRVLIEAQDFAGRILSALDNITSVKCYSLEVKEIMSDPEFQPILQMCGQPGYFTKFMHDPRYAPKLQYLLDKNVFQMHT